MMKILIIGATGQIGHALVRALLKTAHQVTVLVRNGHDLPSIRNINVIKYDEFTPSVFKIALEGIDHVVYGVGRPEQFTWDNSIFNNVNYGLLNTFLNTLKQSSIRRLTYISTYEVFQDVAGEISETNQIADENNKTHYFNAMIRAYKLVATFAGNEGFKTTTIHPAAVYGGLNTGDGITSYIHKLLKRKYWKVPFIVKGRFPVVHVNSLADAIVRSLEGPQGAYLVSDQMTSLREIALTLNKYVRSYVPITMPLWVARIGVSASEALARLLRHRPIMAKVQLSFITSGKDIKTDKVQKELKWSPMSLEEGIKKYLSK